MRKTILFIPRMFWSCRQITRINAMTPSITRLAKNVVNQLMASPTDVSEKNMSYCRFENTLGDLRDCYGAMTSGEGG